MNKKLAIVSVLVSLAYGIWQPQTFGFCLQKLDMIFRWIAIEHPFAIYVIGSLAITFSLLFWRSRKRINENLGWEW